MSALLRIRQLYPCLARNERRLADYLLSQPDRARYLSSQKLAQLCNISQSSVVKFAQKLGYKGFPTLKLALSESLTGEEPGTLSHHILSEDPLKVVGEKLYSEKHSAIRATLDINHEERLSQALSLIRNARRIILAGLGSSGLVAKDFSWKLMKIGFNAVAEQDMHALLASVQAMKTDDLLLAISWSGEQREINLAAQNAARIGAHVLAFTGFTPNSLQQFTTLCLYTVAEEQTRHCASISSITSQLTLTDLLFITLAQQNPECLSDYFGQSIATVSKQV